MCGRYVLYDNPSVEEFSELRIPLRLPETLPPPRYNVAPGTDVLVIRQRGADALDCELLHWGLIPRWVKDRAAWKELINVRAETIDTRPAFRNAFKRWRCLVPADGFYEWRRLGTDPKARRQPYYIHPTDARHFGFAGIVERWQQGDEVVHSCAIVTTAANELIRPLHDRMPAIIGRGDFARWLDPANGDVAALKALLVPYPAERMAAHAVGPAVGNTRNDDPRLIEPVGT